MFSISNSPVCLSLKGTDIVFIAYKLLTLFLLSVSVNKKGLAVIVEGNIKCLIMYVQGGPKKSNPLPYFGLSPLKCHNLVKCCDNVT